MIAIVEKCRDLSHIEENVAHGGKDRISQIGMNAVTTSFFSVPYGPASYVTVTIINSTHVFNFL